MRGVATYAEFLNFFKAYDRVSHMSLLAKMRRYNFHEKAIKTA